MDGSAWWCGCGAAAFWRHERASTLARILLLVDDEVVVVAVGLPVPAVVEYDDESANGRGAAGCDDEAFESGAGAAIGAAVDEVVGGLYLVVAMCSSRAGSPGELGRDVPGSGPREVRESDRVLSEGEAGKKAAACDLHRKQLESPSLGRVPAPPYRACSTV